MKKQFAEFLRTGLLAATLVAGVQLCHGQQGLLLQTYDVELSASANFASLSVAMANKTPTSTTVYKGEVNFLEEDFYVFPVITPGSMVQLVFKGWMKLDPGRYYFYGHSHVYTQLYVDWEKTGDYTFYPLGAWTGQNGTLLTIETAGAYPIYINYFYWRAGEPSSRLDIRWRKLAEDEVVYTEPWQFWSTLNVLDTTTLHSDGSPLFTVSDPASEAWNPWVNTVGVSDIGATTATINGRILAGTPPFTVNLHWGTTDAETGTWATNKSITVAQSLGEISGLIGGLSANQQYFARFSITDSTGVTNWGEGAQSFITLGAPVMGGVSVTEDFFSADLAVNVLRSGDNSTFTVYWGTDLANLASRTLPDAVVGVNLVSLDNLLPNAVYYYTFELSSLYGNASVSGSFLTKGLPVIESITADPSPYGADLHLKLIEPGLNSILTLYWGTQAPVDNASWANTVPLPAPQYGDNVATLSGLQKGATYHYKFEITTQFAPVSISGSFTTVDAFTWVGGANPQASTFFEWDESAHWLGNVVPEDGSPVVFGRVPKQAGVGRVSLGNQTRRMSRLDTIISTDTTSAYHFNNGTIDTPLLFSIPGEQIFNCDMLVSSNMVVAAPKRQANGTDYESLDWSGPVVTGSLINTNANAILTKVGGSRLEFRGDNPYSGEIRVASGYLRLNNIDNELRIGDVRFPNLKSVDLAPILTYLGQAGINRASMRVILNDGAPSLNDKLVVNQRGGTLDLRVPKDSDPLTETIGTLYLDTALSSLRLVQNNAAQGITTIRVKNFKRARHALLYVMCQFSKLGNTLLFKTDNAATTLLADLIGGNGPAGSKTISIIPYIIGGRPYDLENPNDPHGGFFTYTTASGLRMLNPSTECYAGPLDEAETAVGPDANVLLPEGGVTLTRDVTVNALSMNGDLNADTPVTLTIKSGLLYGIVNGKENITLTTGTTTPLCWFSHYTHTWWNTTLTGKLIGSQDFIKAGPAHLYFTTQTDLSEFTGNLYILHGQLIVEKHDAFNPGTDLHVTRSGKIRCGRANFGDISGNGEINSWDNKGLLFGTAGNHDFNGSDLIFDGATVTPGDLRPGILRFTNEGRAVNLADATLNIRIDNFDVDQGRTPTYDIMADESYDEMHDALYFAGNGPVTIGSDVTVNVKVNPDFKPPRQDFSWVILSSNGSITPTADNIVKQLNVDHAFSGAIWSVETGLTIDGRDALILRCRFTNPTLFMVR